MSTKTFAVALLLSFATRAPAQERAQAGLPRADAELQALLQRVLDAPSEAAQRAAFDALRASAGAEHQRLVPQLFLFLQQATDTRDAMLPGVVLAELAVPDQDVIHALVPLLEGADAPLRAALGGVLCGYENRAAEHGADFSAYRPLLEAGLPEGLVRYMIEVDPGAGLLAMMRATLRDPAAPDELRALLWAEHAVADALWKRSYGFVSSPELARATPEAVTQLGVLARHPRWWARLYAAQVGAVEPGLRAAVPLDALAQDAHALVREVARSAAEKR